MMAKQNKAPEPEAEEAPDFAKQRKKEASKVRKQLQANGLFQDEMQQQLDALGMDWQLVRFVFKLIIDGNEAPIFEMQTEKGDTYKQVNPLWNLYKELRKLHNQTLDRLGMNLTRQKKFDVNTGGDERNEALWQLLWSFKEIEKGNYEKTLEKYR